MMPKLKKCCIGIGSQCKMLKEKDLNTACGTATGFYMGYKLENRPNLNDDWFYIIHLVHNELFMKQMAFSFFSNELYVRTKNNGNWSGWQSVTMN